MFQSYFCKEMLFLVKQSTIQYGKIKSKFFQDCAKLARFCLANYMAHHGVQYSCGLLSLFDPCSPNVVSRPQTSRSRYFLRFDDFIGFNL